LKKVSKQIHSLLDLVKSSIIFLQDPYHLNKISASLIDTNLNKY